MKKTITKSILFVCLLFITESKTIGFLDLCAVYVASSYAFQGWCHWTNAQYGKSSTEIIRELRICLAALKDKVNKEQQAIEECQRTLTHLQKELEYYKNMLGLRETLKKQGVS